MFPKEARILVVDDMMTMRKVVKKCLADIGYSNVVEANDGETAWPEIEKAVAEGAPFDVVISDWNMPKMKGIELLERVRTTEGIKAMPFILLTAEAEGSQIAQAAKLGVSGYITKPFSAATLKDKLGAVYAAKAKAA